MWLPDFFYSKTFKIIATVIISVELIIIITLKVVDLYCDEPGCWNKKDWGTNYCMEHINSIYEEAMKREGAYENSQRKNNTSNSYSSKSQRSYSSGKKSTPSRSYNTYSNSYSSRRNDSYDVYNYDDPDDFADDWAEEFGGGNYDGGYDDAYDYWEENYGN